MFTVVIFEQCWSIILQCMQHCFYSWDPQQEEHFPYACKSTPVQHCGCIWNLPSTCVPVREEAMYLTRDVAGEAFAHTRCSHFSAFHIPSWKHTQRATSWETHTNTCTYNALLLCFSWCWRAERNTQLTPSWAGMSFTTRLIDLLIIFFPGDPPVGDQRPPLYPFLLCSVLCWIDKAWRVNWLKNKNKYFTLALQITDFFFVIYTYSICVLSGGIYSTKRP